MYRGGQRCGHRVLVPLSQPDRGVQRGGPVPADPIAGLWPQQLYKLFNGDQFGHLFSCSLARAEPPGHLVHQLLGHYSGSDSFWALVLPEPAAVRLLRDVQSLKDGFLYEIIIHGLFMG